MLRYQDEERLEGQASSHYNRRREMVMIEEGFGRDLDHGIREEGIIHTEADKRGFIQKKKRILKRAAVEESLHLTTAT